MNMFMNAYFENFYFRKLCMEYTCKTMPISILAAGIQTCYHNFFIISAGDWTTDKNKIADKPLIRLESY